MKNILYITNESKKANFKQLNYKDINQLHLIGDRFDSIIIDENVLPFLNEENWIDLRCTQWSETRNIFVQNT